MRLGVGAVVVLGVCACQAPVGSRLYTEDGEPVIGRLQMRDAIYDLTVSSVATNPAFPREAVAVQRARQVDTDELDARLDLTETRSSQDRWSSSRTSIDAATSGGSSSRR